MLSSPSSLPRRRDSAYAQIPTSRPGTRRIVEPGSLLDPAGYASATELAAVLGPALLPSDLAEGLRGPALTYDGEDDGPS